MMRAADEPDPSEKAARALFDVRRAEEARLRRALLDLHAAEQDYIRQFQSVSREKRAPPDHVRRLDEAGRRVDAARRDAALWEAAARETREELGPK